VKCRAWELGSLLDWALERAQVTGGGCLTSLRRNGDLPLVCVQPLLVRRAREAEDLTWISPTRKTRC
jgi:hypothetical protein